jgi:hypothetical protein
MLSYKNYEIKEKIFRAQPGKIGSPTGMESGRGGSFMAYGVFYCRQAQVGAQLRSQVQLENEVIKLVR